MASSWQRMLGVFPPSNHELLAVAVCSSIILVLYYYTVQHILELKSISQTPRQKSWVLTVFSSGASVAFSLPFVASWLTTRHTLEGNKVADYGCAFFVAYLICDLILGSLHYSSAISLLTGWIHHIMYILLISLVVIPYGHAPIFSLCLILELPTFLLAVGNLHPRYRNDNLFACIFFLTRIVMHIQIGVTYGWRAYHTGATWVPTTVLSCALPMHVVWMKGCITGILRRRRVVAAAAATRELTVWPKFPSGASITPTPTASSTAWSTPHVRSVPWRLLSRYTVESALAVVRARRLAFRRSRRLMYGALRDTLLRRGVSSEYGEDQHPQLQPVAAAATAAPSAYDMLSSRWFLVRKRVAGRMRRNPREGEVVEASSAVVVEGVCAPALEVAD